MSEMKEFFFPLQNTLITLVEQINCCAAMFVSSRFFAEFFFLHFFAASNLAQFFSVVIPSSIISVSCSILSLNMQKHLGNGGSCVTRRVAEKGYLHILF